MRYINLRFTYLLTYLLTYFALGVGLVFSAFTEVAVRPPL